jgi:phosphoribosylformimino-5-aminoimidazole carboxamide ribotide isomerase
LTDQPYIAPIVPVLDLMIGQVVLAAGGNRDQYLPVDSKLTRSARPLDVAKAMFQQTGCDWIYLADIDSFSGAAPAWHVYGQLLETGFGLWVDANWLSDGCVEAITDRMPVLDRLRVIVSSETMSSADQFSKLGQLLDEGIRPIFSLDLKGQHVIGGSPEIAGQPPLDLIGKAIEAGARDVIVLDLGLVGTMQHEIETAQATTMELIEQIVRQFPNVRVTSGGGVASAEDAQRWLDAGCDHVLAASAIHHCRLTPDDVAELLPRSARERLRRTAK